MRLRKAGVIGQFTDDMTAFRELVENGQLPRLSLIRPILSPVVLVICKTSATLDQMFIILARRFVILRRVISIPRRMIPIP